MAFLTSENKTLPDGPRIIELNDEIINFIPEEVDGPFDTIQELKKSSTIYKNLKLSNPKRAQRIIDQKNIVKVVNSIIYPDDDSEYFNHIYNLMLHSSTGKVDRNGVLGIHLYNPDRVRILEITKPVNKQGIWEASIEVFCQNSNKWIKKANSTTFFPRSWNLQRLVLECKPAYEKRIRLTERKYIGLTQSGVSITMIFDNGRLKTIYPNYE